MADEKTERDEVAVILNERSRQIRDVLKEEDIEYIELDLAKILSISDNCYLEIDKLRRAVSKTVKTEIFSGSVLKLPELKDSINAFTAGKTIRNISMQEASDLIVVMVNYEE